MLKYLIKRIISAVPIFLGITVIVYVLMNMAPGSALDVMAASADAAMSEAQLEALKVSLGLDKPVLVRYVIWLSELVHGDWGTSYRTTQDVFLMISQRVLPSLLLMGTGLLLAILIALPLGIMAAYKPYSRWDSVSSVVALLGTTLPGFFISLLGVYLFAVRLGWLPASGMYTVGKQTIGDYIHHLILPASVIALGSMGNLIKQTRGACMEVFGEDFMKTARSKGIGEFAVVLRHGFRNSLIPVVTTICLQLPMLIGGATITEQIFAWPGMGSLMISSINSRDYPVVMGVAVLIAVTVLTVNIILDILYGLLDPRVTYR